MLLTEARHRKGLRGSRHADHRLRRLYRGESVKPHGVLPRGDPIWEEPGDQASAFDSVTLPSEPASDPDQAVSWQRGFAGTPVLQTIAKAFLACLLGPRGSCLCSRRQAAFPCDPGLPLCPC